jgi:hypothetical protein
MNTLVVALISFAFLVQTTYAGPGRVVNLVLPRTLSANEVVWIELKLGAIARGSEIEIETKSGKTLGVVSPHGIRSGDEAGTYTIPVPPHAISNKRVSLRLTLNQGRAKRAPTTREVKSVRLKITSPLQ